VIAVIKQLDVVVDFGGILMSIAALVTSYAALQRVRLVERRTKSLQIARKLAERAAPDP
jgi:hypothetical protein